MREYVYLSFDLPDWIFDGFYIYVSASACVVFIPFKITFATYKAAAVILDLDNKNTILVDDNIVKLCFLSVTVYLNIG